MRTLLLIMNPRDIPECMNALHALDTPKMWLSYMTESQLEPVIANVVSETNYDRYSIISDDTIPTQQAFDEVLRIHDQYPDDVSCGWVNIDSQCGLSTYHPTPLRGTGPSNDTYSFVTIDEAHGMHGIQRTYFHGQVFTTMTRDMWMQYPFASYNGCASDLHQCVRLQDGNVPIWTSAMTYVEHVKEVRNQLDQAHEKRLLIGERPASTYFDRKVKT